MRPMLNLTQHQATPEQIEAGVVDLPADLREELASLLTFDEPPSFLELEFRANKIARLLCDYDSSFDRAMIGGAPYLMGPLVRALGEFGVLCFYSFTKRESVETTDAHGNVRKTSVFRHVAFIHAR